MIKTMIIEGPLPPMANVPAAGDVGAELIFYGRVRAVEHGEVIVALDYEHYPQMAQTQLQELAEATVARFPITGLSCVHRVGRVPVGDASLRVVIRSGHRLEGLEAMAWFISELKQRVPIWKWAITTGGRRFAALCDRSQD